VKWRLEIFIGERRREIFIRGQSKFENVVRRANKRRITRDVRNGGGGLLRGVVAIIA
jgi:hypothetical protein